VRARDRLEIDEATPILLSKIIVSSWDANPKSRPEFGKTAKQLESDIILLQIALPAVFVAGAASANLLASSPDEFAGNVFETQSQTATKGQNLGFHSPIIADPAALTNRPAEQKKPINFLSMYTKKKKIFLLVAAVLVVLIILIVLLVIYINPQQRNASESSAVDLTTTTSAGAITLNVNAFSTKSTTTVSQSGAFIINMQRTDATTTTIDSHPYSSFSLDTISTLISPSSSTPSTSTIAAPKSLVTVVSTFAGNPVSPTKNGYGTAARFYSLFGIAFRASDNMVFVSDSQFGIRAINSSGYVSTIAQWNSTIVDGGLSIARFANPYGLAVDNNGDIFVSDTPNLLRKISDGFVTTVAGNTDLINAIDGLGTNAFFDGLSYITSDGNGNLYSTEFGGRIRKIDANGDVTTLAGSSSLGNAVGPGIDAKFGNPVGIVFDKTTNLIYIADYSNHVIKSMDLQGNVNFVAGSIQGFEDGNSTAARFWFPTGLTLDGKGNLIIADSHNHAIRRLNLTSLEVSTIAGNRVEGSMNGFGNESTFSFPEDVAVVQDGSVLVTDFGNDLVRKIEFLQV
jgi:NHL repeat